MTVTLIDRYMHHRGAGVALEELLLLEAKRTKVDVKDFKRRLKRGLVKKSTVALT